MKTNKKLFLSILGLSSINFSVIHAAHHSKPLKSTPLKPAAPPKPAPKCFVKNVFVKNVDDEFDSCASCKKTSWFGKTDQETCCEYLFDSKIANNKNIDLLKAHLILSSFNGPNWIKNHEKEMVNDIAETTGCDHKTSKKALEKALEDALEDALHELTKHELTRKK